MVSERQEDDRGRLRRRALSFSLTVVAAALVIGSLPLTLPLIALVDLVRRRRFAWTPSGLSTLCCAHGTPGSSSLQAVPARQSQPSGRPTS